MGEKGHSPKEYESNEVFRIEEFLEGRPLTFLELRNPFVSQTLMEKICDINNDQDLLSVILESSEPNSNFSKDVIWDRKNGWFHRYM